MNLLQNSQIQPLLEGQTPEIRQRREHALQILSAALTAVDPAQAVKNSVQIDTSSVTLSIDSVAYNLPYYDQIYVVGAGKAGAPMAGALAEILQDRLTAGSVNVKYGHTAGAPQLSTLKIVESGHPIPDEAGVAGARQIIEILEKSTERDLVLAVISGGASALLELPVVGVSLADMQTLTQKLLKVGATINQLNNIRKHLSQVKGGNLARLAYPATLVSLILSDVVGSPLDIIGSGPTVPDTSTYQQAWEALEQFGLTKAGELPNSIIQHLQKGLQGEIPETPKPTDPVFARAKNVIVGDNRVAALAATQAASDLGYNPLMLSTFVEGEAREVAKVLAGVAKEVAAFNSPIAKPACILAGGETTVTIQGTGKGGRNQEMALAIALALDGLSKIIGVPLATDGSDGPTDAAGAIVDGQTISKARELGLDPLDFLARNDAYHFFEATGDLLKSGPTNTNVNDLTLFLVWE